MANMNVEFLLADVLDIDYAAPLSHHEIAAVNEIEAGIRFELGELRPAFAVAPPPAPIAAVPQVEAANVFAIDFSAPLSPDEAAAVARIEADLRRQIGDLPPAFAQPAPPLIAPVAAPLPFIAPQPIPEFWYPADPEPEQEASVSPVPANEYIKRPANSYMLWSRERRAKILAENPEVGNGGASKLLGQRWKAEDPEVVRYYEDLAAEGRRLHREKYPHYQYHANNKRKTRKAAANQELNAQPAPKRRRVQKPPEQPPAPPAPLPAPAPGARVLMLPRGAQIVYAEDDWRHEQPFFVDANGHPVELIPIGYT